MFDIPRYWFWLKISDLFCSSTVLHVSPSESSIAKISHVKEGLTPEMFKRLIVRRVPLLLLNLHWDVKHKGRHPSQKSYFWLVELFHMPDWNTMPAIAIQTAQIPQGLRPLWLSTWVQFSFRRSRLDNPMYPYPTERSKTRAIAAQQG